MRNIFYKFKIVGGKSVTRRIVKSTDELPNFADVVIIGAGLTGAAPSVEP